MWLKENVLSPPPLGESWLCPCDQYGKKIIVILKPYSVIDSMITHSYLEYMGAINIRAHIVFLHKSIRTNADYNQWKTGRIAAALKPVIKHSKSIHTS